MKKVRFTQDQIIGVRRVLSACSASFGLTGAFGGIAVCPLCVDDRQNRTFKWTTLTKAFALFRSIQ